MHHSFGIMPVTDFELKIDADTGVANMHIHEPLSAQIRRIVNDVELSPESPAHAYVTRLRSAAYRSLPSDLLRSFESIRSGSFAPTALVITGLPSDQVESAPAACESARDRKPSNLSEGMLVLLGSLAGEPYSLAGEGAKLINDLIPTLEDLERLTGNGSQRRLGFHTENAAHRWLLRDRDLSPHALMLCGVVAPVSAAPRTLVANGRIAASRLSAEDREILRGPCVKIALPLRQRREAHTTRAEASAVLTGSAGAETVTAAFYGDMMEPVSDRAGRALAAFEAALESCAVGLTITPGVLAYIPNGYTLHARDAFIPAFDPHGRAQRWLQRIFLTCRLDAFQVGGQLDERVFELPVFE